MGLSSIFLLLLILGIFSPRLSLFWLKPKEARTRAVSNLFYFGLFLLVLIWLLPKTADINGGDSIIAGLVISIPFFVLAFRAYWKAKKSFQTKTILRTNQDLSSKDVELKAEKSKKEENKPKYKKPDGLDLCEYIMLKSNPKITPNTSFPQYWDHEWHVTNPKQVAMSLVDRGFYVPASAKESLGLLKLVEIKIIAKNAGLKVSGKKEDVINRIIESLTPEQIKPHLQEGIYVISDIGKVSISDDHFSYFLWLNKIELYKYAGKFDQTLTNVKLYNDFLWAQLLPKTKTPINGDYADFCIGNQNAYYYLVSIGKQDQALPYLVRSFWTDINGCSSYDGRYLSHDENSTFVLLFFTKSWLFETLNLFDNTFISFVMKPFYAEGFILMKSVYSVRFETVVNEELNALKLPKCFLSVSDGINLINATTEDDLERFKKITLDISKSLLADILSPKRRKIYTQNKALYQDLLTRIFEMADKLNINLKNLSKN